MYIHVVQPEETVQTIAESYGLSAERLIRDNELPNPDNLVIGQTIVIVYPQVTYTVQSGDTLESIAQAFQVDPIEILRNNPSLSEGDYLYEGETLVIKYETDKRRGISTNGYVYPFIDKTILRKTLPFLTYLTVFSYRVTEEGKIAPIEDEELIRTAKDYGVAPIMLVTVFSGRDEKGEEYSHFLLNNPEYHEQVIDNILEILINKGYYGLNIDSQDVLWDDRQLYVDFVTKLAGRVREAGFQVFVTLTQNTFPYISGELYRGPEYAQLGTAANNVLLLSYEWGRTRRAPSELPTMEEIREILDYVKGEIEPDKISIGIPCIGYDWELPYVKDVSQTQALSYDSVISLAVEAGAEIEYDEALQAPFYYYETGGEENRTEHVVYFKDARSIDYLVGLVPEYGFDGIGIWNIMSYFAQFWLVVNNQYEIDKVM